MRLRVAVRSISSLVVFCEGERSHRRVHLAGRIAAETGVVMLIYLNQALAEIKARRSIESRALTRNDLHDAVMGGAVERVRPKMMTVVAIMAGLLPIMWSTGTGSKIMQRIAVPIIGGIISSTLLTRIVNPAINSAWSRVSAFPIETAPANRRPYGPEPPRSDR